MDNSWWLDGFSLLVSATLGFFFAILLQRILRKRGIFTYSVFHSRIALAANDPIFGVVQVTWNNNPVANLYSSRVELHNESLNDYEDVNLCIFSHGATFLSERTEIVGTPHILNWSEEFTRSLIVAPGQQPSDLQRARYATRREYTIQTMNRGQIVRLDYLSIATGDAPPYIGINVLHKGVKVRPQKELPQIFGVPQPYAALIGIMLGIVIVIPAIVYWISILWIASLLSFIYGIVVLIPGASAIHLYRWIRKKTGD